LQERQLHFERVFGSVRRVGADDEFQVVYFAQGLLSTGT
jgi:hypothetical protein